jgi:hypothetical protein
MKDYHSDHFDPEDGKTYYFERSITLLTSTLYRDLRTESILVLNVCHRKLEKRRHRPPNEDMGGPLHLDLEQVLGLRFDSEEDVT